MLYLGSMDTATLTSTEDLPPPTGKGPTRSCLVTPLQGSAPHALMFDVTHDNESSLDKRSAEDSLSTAALVAFSYSAIGSNKGFDDIYPKHIDLVGEKRKYEAFPDEQTDGISAVKRVLNHLHTEMVLEGYSEGHVHQENDVRQLVFPVKLIYSSEPTPVHRDPPNTAIDSERVYRRSSLCFWKLERPQGSWVQYVFLSCITTSALLTMIQVNPIKLRRQKAAYILGYSISIPSYEVVKDPDLLRGLPSKLLPIPPGATIEGSDAEGPFTDVVVPENFPPGSMMVFATSMTGLDPNLDVLCHSGAAEAFGDLDLVDLNVLLHRADGEERDATGGH